MHAHVYELKLQTRVVVSARSPNRSSRVDAPRLLVAVVLARLALVLHCKGDESCYSGYRTAEGVIAVGCCIAAIARSLLTKTQLLRSRECSIYSPAPSILSALDSSGLYRKLNVLTSTRPTYCTRPCPDGDGRRRGTAVASRSCAEAGGRRVGGRRLVATLQRLSDMRRRRLVAALVLSRRRRWWRRRWRRRRFVAALRLAALRRRARRWVAARTRAARRVAPRRRSRKASAQARASAARCGRRVAAACRTFALQSRPWLAESVASDARSMLLIKSSMRVKHKNKAKLN